ncbi:hypothetical protein [Hymenobacter sp. UYCo722]|uniref:hypothetical protein n=1 Tax=Hymenobacter sp. UYCo722 TaxID=3156335 RepID=UPI0033975C7A
MPIAFLGQFVYRLRWLLWDAGAAALPAELTPISELAATPDAFVLHGGSIIVGPDGAVLAGPIYDAELILTAEIYLGCIWKE